MNTIVFPYGRGPIFPDTVSVELERTNPYKVEDFDPSQSPFSDLSSDELLEELWEEGVNRRFKPPCYLPKNQGNYVRSYVLSNLRIKAKSTRLKVGCNLEALWDALPVELIISIFEFLHPIDLYHAIRATKGLRYFLLNKDSTSIWKESFLNHPDIPFYPPDVSAPKWTSLIFGPATCDICGSDNSLIDYAFRLRKCDTCMDYLYFDDDDMLNAIQPIIGEFHDLLDDVWSVAIKTYRYSSFLYISEEYFDELEPRYSLKEITERAHEMRKHLLDIRAGAPNAQTEYQTFLNVTRAAIQEHMKSTILMFHRSKKALLKKGHDPRDVERAQDNFKSLMGQSVYANLLDPVLSRSKLWKYLPGLDLYVDDCRRYRLGNELVQRISKREGVISAFYWKTIKTYLTPEKTPYLPHPETLFNLRFFADYIRDPSESVGVLNYTSARQKILHFAATYIAKRKRRLFKTLLNTGFFPPEVTGNSNSDDFLGLATAVFECCQNCVFVGWEDAGIHLRCLHAPFYPSDVDSVDLIRFSDTGLQALKNLAALLSLDLRSALAKDLDALNKRFICKTCKFHRQAGLNGHHSMTWRECLTHALRMKNISLEQTHGILFDVLSDALTMSILALEQPFPPPSDPNWLCKHCHTYFEPVKRAEVVAHAKTVHAITKPVEGVDFVYCRTERSPKRSPLFIGLDERSNHRCLRCLCPKGLRLWKKTPDLVCHILDKHAVQSKDLIEGVDWIKVKAVEDDSWIKEKMRAEGITLA